MHIIKTEVKESKIITLLRGQLYTMQSNESSGKDVEPLVLSWANNDESNYHVVLIENIIRVIAYVSQNPCNDNVIENMLSQVQLHTHLDETYELAIVCCLIAVINNGNLADEASMRKTASKTLNVLIEGLEQAYRLYFSNNVKGIDDENSIDIEIDTSKLCIGDVIKNYKEMCHLLGQEVKTGKSKQLQLKDWERYFSWDKSGQKFIIADIYDKPLSKEDARKRGNNNVYVHYIELVLMKYLSKFDGYTRTLTKRNWLEILGMLSNKYQKIPYEQLERLDYSIHKFEIDHFYYLSNKRLQDIFNSAINSLKKQKLIIPEWQLVIVDKDNNYLLATDLDKKRILQAERYVMKNVMGLENMDQVFRKFKKDQFYRNVNDIIYQEYGWIHYFKQLKIIYSKKNINTAISDSEVKLQKDILNEKIADAIRKSTEKFYFAEMERKQRIKQVFELSDTSDLESFQSFVKRTKNWVIADTYLEAQKLLIDELICLGHRNIDFSLDKLIESAKDVDGLFR